MKLEIRSITSDDLRAGELPADPRDFRVGLRVEIGAAGEAGAETFHFVAASAPAVAREVAAGEFKLLRGYVLMSEFDWKTARRAVENVFNHARGYRDNSWPEVIAFFSRYARHDAEDRHA